MRKRPEILAPVGDETMLAAAINAGADAVYFGVKELNMRATAGNFELSQLKNITRRCHDSGLNAYLTLNTIVYDNELKKVARIISDAQKAGVDAVIAWDMAVVTEALRQGMEVHLSTQASVSNFEALRHFAEMGIKRIVLARECTLEQIRSIVEKIAIEKLDVEIEAFVHGAMCVSISGRCLMSQFMFCRSANRGDCLQPCRHEYDVMDKENGHVLTIGNEYVLSPKDLCAIKFIDKLMDAGIVCFKIEGRVKTPEYVQVVVSAYRRGADACIEGSFTPELAGELEAGLKRVFNRGFSSGFYMGEPIDQFTDVYGARDNIAKQYVGRVMKYYARVGVAEIRVDSYSVSLGDMIMVQGPTTGVLEARVESMQVEHAPVEKVEKGASVGIKLPSQVRPNDKVYLIKPGSM